MAIMAERKLSELPVIDERGMPLGLLDITDLLNRNFTDKDSSQSLTASGAATGTDNLSFVSYPKLRAEANPAEITNGDLIVKTLTRTPKGAQAKMRLPPARIQYLCHLKNALNKFPSYSVTWMAY